MFVIPTDKTIVAVFHLRSTYMNIAAVINKSVINLLLLFWSLETQCDVFSEQLCQQTHYIIVYAR